MPELPEVEVTRQRIAPLLLGRRIRSVRTSRPSDFFLTPPVALRRALRGRSLEALRRHGKYLVADFGAGDRLLIHLGMTGQLFSSAASSVRLLSATRARRAATRRAAEPSRPDAHTHLQLAFEDAGPEVYFRDVRKFGKLLWLPAGATHERLDRLGRDALEVSGELLFAASRRRKAAIKSLLLDQAVLAGCGNIYADEALFLAGVRPARRAGAVTRAECEAIAAALRRVLRRSIETGGSSISDFIAPDGADGAYQSERRVYARAGEPCSRCGAAIRRRVIGQRASHFCASCQK